MPAVSKKQQKFFGIVRAIQKGEMAPTTPETAKAAEDMKKGDVKKFASTKHKGLPEKKKIEEDRQIKKIIKQLRKSVKAHDKQADTLEKKIEEESNPRIPRKKGQPANSKKHSDLYTDENPKGTIHGLGFKDVAKARASVAKIKASGKKHAHKIQAAIAMEQRAKEMGKTREAAVYRRYIEQMKKKTKEMNKESLIDTLEKEMSTNEYYEIGTDSYVRHTMKMTPGQPIQNFRKYTEIIKSEDIEKFKNEEETIDKYKKRYKEKWKEELDKAVERMKKEL